MLSDPIPKNSAFGPLCPRETVEMDDGIEESWHDASEEGYEMACDMVEEGSRE